MKKVNDTSLAYHHHNLETIMKMYFYLNVKNTLTTTKSTHWHTTAKTTHWHSTTITSET
jgi:hypothetical protein